MRLVLSICKLDPLRIFGIVEASNFKFGIQHGFETSLPKNKVVYQNWRGFVPRDLKGVSKKIVVVRRCGFSTDSAVEP